MTRTHTPSQKDKLWGTHHVLTPALKRALVRRLFVSFSPIHHPLKQMGQQVVTPHLPSAHFPFSRRCRGRERFEVIDGEISTSGLIHTAAFPWGSVASMSVLNCLLQITYKLHV
jgi:hypothetical protein